MSRLMTKLRREPHWIALIIFIVLCVWVASGVLGKAEAVHPKDEKQVPELQKVKVTTMYAEEVDREVRVYGRTEPDRTATLRAEVKGQVINILVLEGKPVQQGQALVELDKNDLEQQLDAAKAALKQAEIELVGAKSLSKQGLQSEVAQAQAEASVAKAQAQVTALELAIRNTTVRAPFDGVMNKHYMEVGDYLSVGDPVATVVDLDPLVIKADVTERSVQELELGYEAIGRLVSGNHLHGQVRYISSVSNEGTNTFKIEVAVPNPDAKLRAGMSTELSIPLQKTWAVKITPSVMSLDERGNLGVKVVEQNRVHFVPINMVKSDSTGVWLTGLGEQADVITLGQAFVREGDEVEVVKEMTLSQAQSASVSENNNGMAQGVK
ncbi:efflux RND transporter periplasmic adaptor subunit [Paraneptunicella aestuarii]|nr:efflux RND transporter periplasmic adaptor subunit [Paraneptunicella aestuarii]